MTTRKGPTSAALRYLHREFIGDDQARRDSLEEERINAEIARQIHDLRKAAKLTQAELARLAGTTASVICRLEDADYTGHSLSMLRRIAACLNKRLEVSFVPVDRTLRSSRRKQVLA